MSSAGSAKSATRSLKMPRTTKKTEKHIPYARGFKKPDKQKQNVALGQTTNRAFTLDTDYFFPELPFPSSPDDWLAQYVEKGQTVEQFKTSTPWLSPRKIVRYQGEFDKTGKTMKAKYPASKVTIVEICMENEEHPMKPNLDSLCNYSASFLQVPVESLPPIKIVRNGAILSVQGHPKHRLQYREVEGKIQLCCTSVLSLLREKMVPQTLCLVAVTMFDLYEEEPDLFIAGLAQGNRRVAVFSFCRYDPAFSFSSEFWYEHWTTKMNTSKRKKEIQARSSKILVHEICHLLGLDHCIYFACVMNGSGHLAEDYSQPHHLCPVCLRKLALLTGLDEIARYRDLAVLYRLMGLDEEETWCRNRSNAMDTQSCRDQFDCGLCECRLDTLEMLELHLVTCEVYECCSCFIRVKNLSEMKKHFKTEHKDGKYLRHLKIDQNDSKKISFTQVSIDKV